MSKENKKMLKKNMKNIVILINIYYYAYVIKFYFITKINFLYVIKKYHNDFQHNNLINDKLFLIKLSLK
jgi:hypothetical protein